jgi:ribose transport system substrate-binding protein
MRRCYKQTVITLAMCIGTAVSAAAATSGVLVTKQGDIKPMCGSKPMVVGLADGYGGNTWRKTTLAELKDELARCGNVKRLIYTNANGDQQKANTDVNSMVAQGVNVLLILPDFGAAQIPALRAATKAGVTVIPYLSTLPGRAGKDYTINVSDDLFARGATQADWFGKNLKSGNIIFLGGLAGSPTSQAALDGFKSRLDRYPGLKLLQNDFVVTNLNPVDAAKAVQGMIARYPKIDGVVTDYGVTALAAVKAFEQSHLPVPAVATAGSNNELSCKYTETKKSGKPFAYTSLDGTTSIVRFAARRGVSEFQGTPNNEPTSVIEYVYADSGAGIDPKCDLSAPPDADFSSALPADKLKMLFSQ